MRFVCALLSIVFASSAQAKPAPFEDAYVKSSANAGLEVVAPPEPSDVFKFRINVLPADSLFPFSETQNLFIEDLLDSCFATAGIQSSAESSERRLQAVAILACVNKGVDERKMFDSGLLGARVTLITYTE